MIIDMKNIDLDLLNDIINVFYNNKGYINNYEKTSYTNPSFTIHKLNCGNVKMTTKFYYDEDNKNLRVLDIKFTKGNDDEESTIFSCEQIYLLDSYRINIYNRIIYLFNVAEFNKNVINYGKVLDEITNNI